MTSEERGVWADLIALAGECGQEGAIADNDGEALPRDFIANQFNIKQVLLDRVIAKCKHEGRIIEEQLGDIITIANWGHYQSEYDRQKGYRQDSPPDNHQRQEAPPAKIAAQAKPVEPPQPKSPSKILDYEETIDPLTKKPCPPEHLRYLELLKKSKYTNAYGEMTGEETAEFDELVSQRRKQSAELLAKIPKDKDGHYIIKK